MRASIVLAALIGMLALACGSQDTETGGDVSAAPESARAPATSPPAPSATAPSGAESDVVTECRALAAKQEWQSALDPCTRAAAELPDDLGIRHALQQAQAAAAEKARGALGRVQEGG